MFEILLFALWSSVGQAQEVGTGNMVKMCLFYDSPSGHARTDPILSQTCASDHVHTFYGPQNFHPNTSYADIKDTNPSFSSSPWNENQSLYWHPSIYRIADNDDGTKTYTRISDLFSSPYYRWDNSVKPETEAFPPKFRMIAFSDQDGADKGGETGSNFFMECCNDGEACDTWTGALSFPRKNCQMLGMALAMPTCWNGKLGIDNDHKDHVKFTLDGTVAGECPTGFNRRLPQVQLFVRISNYKGAKYKYTLSDENDAFHVDFMNGWKEGKLQEIINGCPIIGDEATYNPPCNCDAFLTNNFQLSGPVCDEDVRKLILDEATDVVDMLPRGGCQGKIIPKSWSVDPPLECEDGGCMDMTIEVKGDKFSKADKNRWLLHKKSGTKFEKVQKKGVKKMKKKWVKCLPTNECYRFRITDKKKNGIPTGFYKIKFGDVSIKGVFKNGGKKDILLNCNDLQSEE